MLSDEPGRPVDGVDADTVAEDFDPEGDHWQWDVRSPQAEYLEPELCCVWKEARVNEEKGEAKVEEVGMEEPPAVLEAETVDDGLPVAHWVCRDRHAETGSASALTVDGSRELRICRSSL